MRLRVLLLLTTLTGCAGPTPKGPPPPSPAEAGVDPHYTRAFAALQTHPAVQAFAAAHLPPTEPMAIEVSPEVVPLDYALLAPAMLRETSGNARGERLQAVQDSLATLAAADHHAPDRADGLPTLSRMQRRPLVLFFGRPQHGRLGAQLYPNPYRRDGYAAVRDGQPGLALLVVFDDAGNVARIYGHAIE